MKKIRKIRIIFDTDNVGRSVFLQLAAQKKKDTIFGELGARKIVSPSYFLTALVK